MWEINTIFVAIYNDENEKHHIYITNIQKDILNAKILQIYMGQDGT